MAERPRRRKAKASERKKQPVEEKKTEKPVPRMKPFRPERFEIGNQLGKGSYGVVHLAHDKQRGDMPLVLKKIKIARPDEGIDGLTERDLQAEAMAMRLLDDVCSSRRADRGRAKLSKGIVPCLLDVFQDKDHFYLSMEFLGGDPAGGQWTTLENHLETLREGPLSARVTVAENLINAVKIMHAHGVVNRDLKPDNTMINTDTLDIQLIDLGMACFTEPPAAAAAAPKRKAKGRAKKASSSLPRASKEERSGGGQPGVCGPTCIGWGTPLYIAPEALEDAKICYFGKDAAKATDIFSLGITLLELFAESELPVLIDDMIRRANVKDEDTLYLSKKELPIDSYIHEEFVLETLRKMLYKDPQQRSITSLKR